MSRYITVFLIFTLCFAIIPYLTTLRLQPESPPKEIETLVSAEDKKPIKDEAETVPSLCDVITARLLKLRPKLEEKESLLTLAGIIYTDLRLTEDDKNETSVFFNGEEDELTSETLKRLKKSEGQERFDRVYKLIKTEEIPLIKYEGKPIKPLIHEISSGKTEFAKDEDGKLIPYLSAVDSPYDEASDEYLSTKSFTEEELKERFKNLENISFDDNKQEWLRDIKRTASGAVLTLTVGNTETDGETVRKLLELKSPCFSYRYKEGVFTFTVRGKGAQVGLSLYGAEQMARRGKTAEEILKHYYKGVTIEKIKL